MSRAEFLATRRSLVDRLGDWNDGKRWQQFFDSYWKLIHCAARKAGLTESEAQEVVQETLITVAKKIDRLKYDPALGSFKGWLLNITRWRIADQFRKRKNAGEPCRLTRAARCSSPIPRTHPAPNHGPARRRSRRAETTLP